MGSRTDSRRGLCRSVATIAATPPVINTKLETLKKAMQEVAGDRKDPPIILSADAKTPHQSVITVMDAARQLGFVHLNFATVRSNDNQ